MTTVHVKVIVSANGRQLIVLVFLEQHHVDEGNEQIRSTMFTMLWILVNLASVSKICDPFEEYDENQVAENEE